MIYIYIMYTHRQSLYNFKRR